MIIAQHDYQINCCLNLHVSNEVTMTSESLKKYHLSTMLEQDGQTKERNPPIVQLTTISIHFQTKKSKRLRAESIYRPIHSQSEMLPLCYRSIAIQRL